MNIDTLSEKLYLCYSRDLCYPKIKDNWSEDNKSLGMCAITSLVVNDYFGGDICKMYVDCVSHYFNLIDEKIIDLTAKQFDHEVDYKDFEIVKREDILTEDTIKRYQVLKERLEGIE